MLVHLENISTVSVKCNAKVVQYFSLAKHSPFKMTEKFIFEQTTWIKLYLTVSCSVQRLFASMCLQGALHNGISVLCHYHNK